MKSEKKSTVIIRTNDKTHKTIEAAILNFDRTNHIITIDSRHLASNDSLRVSLLILEEDNILECQGVVRKPYTPGFTEISMFNIKSKESRSSARYTINTEAAIENVIIAGKIIPLTSPIPVTVENISTGGVLISTSHPSLNVNSSFQLKIHIAGNDVVINTSIVRILNSPNGERKLGCCFNSLSVQ